MTKKIKANVGHMYGVKIILEVPYETSKCSVCTQHTKEKALEQIHSARNSILSLEKVIRSL